MSSDQQDALFRRLIAPLLDRLKRIASGSRQEQSVDDLKSEAWLAAHDIRQETGIEYEPEDEGFQQAIVSRLQKAFGMFADRPFRFAIRIDQDHEENDGAVRENSVTAALAAPAAYRPEAALELAEEERERDCRLAERFAEAIAYVRALDHFDGDHDVLAVHLAITARVLKFRCARAEIALRSQPSLFDGVEVVEADFVPCAGRRLRSGCRLRTWRNLCTLARPMQLRIFHALPMRLGRRSG